MGVATGFGLLSTIGFVDVGLVFWFFSGLVLGAVVGFLTGDGSLFGCLFMNLFRVVWFKVGLFGVLAGSSAGLFLACRVSSEGFISVNLLIYFMNFEFFGCLVVSAGGGGCVVGAC